MLESEERIRLQKAQLNDANNRIQELEVKLEQQKGQSLEESERDNNTKVCATRNI